MQRPLGRNERDFWVLDKQTEFNFTLVVRLSGPLDPEQLKKALTAVQHRHPLLGVRIDGDPPGFLPSVNPIPLQVLERADDDHWRRRTEGELVTRIPSTEGPLVRVTLLSSPQVHELLITFLHAIGDALSGIHFIRDLLQALGMILEGQRPVLAPRPASVPLDALLPTRVRGLEGALKAGSFVGRMLPGLLSRPRKLPGNDEVPLAQREARMLPHELSEATSEKLLQRARAEGCTLHGVLMATALRAIARQFPESEPISLACSTAVDLRSLLQGDIAEDIGVFVAPVTTFHSVSKSASLWPLAREATKKVHQARERDVLVATRLQGGMMPRDIRKSLELFAHPAWGAFGITNIRRVELPERVGPLSLEKVHFVTCARMLGSTLGLAASSFRGRMFLNYVYTHPVASPSQIQAVVRDAVAELHTAA
ncbi:phthiocerol/phthiodiolone dimycocerosyl transferase family protein [Archangium lipolyticum]|uniref:phthiocerol/phthiodiolone dimycocerosyl transferase family protein n=1 Tax=Archangium lipolyticum TaxID=2970465 RepID=UPI002149DE06|nr:condensation domain-containing protein [Archangium lipolyticum]